MPKDLGQAIHEAEEYIEDNYDENADRDPIELLLERMRDGQLGALLYGGQRAM